MSDERRHPAGRGQPRRRGAHPARLRARATSPIDVVVARDGAEALDYLFGTGAHAGRDVADLPQVVLLDLKLPKVDGLEVLRRMRADARTRLLPVVILTSSEEDGPGESYDLGANSYVRKPVDFDQFVDAVQPARPLLAGAQRAATRVVIERRHRAPCRSGEHASAWAFRKCVAEQEVAMSTARPLRVLIVEDPG